MSVDVAAEYMTKTYCILLFISLKHLVLLLNVATTKLSKNQFASLLFRHLQSRHLYPLLL